MDEWISEIHPPGKTEFDRSQEGNHIGVNLEGVRLRENHQSQRDKHCGVILSGDLWFPGADVEANGELLLNWCGVSNFLQDGNF